MYNDRHENHSRHQWDNSWANSKYTGESKKSPAIAQVVNEFVRRQKAKEFGGLIMEGAFDYPCSLEEIQELDR